MDAETRTRTRLSKVLLCSEEKRTYYIPYIHTFKAMTNHRTDWLLKEEKERTVLVRSPASLRINL